jgi:MFS family permease
MSTYQELIDAKGRLISQRDLFLSMGVNAIAGFLGTAWFAMTFGMPLIMFMQAIGASGLLIGMVTTVRLVAMSAQIPGALASEGFRSRKPFWSTCALINRALWFVIAAMALWCPPSKAWLPLAILAVILLSDILGNASSAPWLSWMTDLIPLHISGRFWGIRQSVITVASLAGLVLSGQILDASRDPYSRHASGHGFAIVFAIAATLGIGDILVHLFVREPRPEPTPPGQAIHRRILAPFARRDYRLLTLALGSWNFGLSMVGAFALVYLKRDFAVTYSQLAALGIAGSLGAIVTGAGFGQLIDRIGARRLGSLLFIATPLPFVPWLFINHATLRLGPFIFPQSIALLALAGILSGGICSAVALCQYRLAAELSSRRGRTMSMAVLWSSVGLLSALGPTTGGLIMDRFPSHPGLIIPSGLPFSFFHAQLILVSLLIWLVSLPLLLAIRPSRPHPVS